MSVVVRKATQRRSVTKVLNVHKVKYRFFTATKLERHGFSNIKFTLKLCKALGNLIRFILTDSQLLFLECYQFEFT